MDNLIKTLIIGSGPAGLTAAIYTARAALGPVLFSGIQPGGQLTTTINIENYPGFAHPISGSSLISQMTQQAQNFGTKIINAHVVSVNLLNTPFTITTESNSVYKAQTIIIATGASPRYLGLDSETKFKSFGVSSCAVCDGFFFKNKDVVVVGGGNSAIEEALQLTKYVNSVTVIHRKDKFKAEQILQSRLFNNPKIQIIFNSVISEIVGTDNPKSVTSVKIRNLITGSASEIACNGVFVAIGYIPNTSLFKQQLILDDMGYIVTEPNSTKTNIAGVFAAGDVHDKFFRQAITAASSGCMAAIEAENFLSRL